VFAEAADNKWRNVAQFKYASQSSQKDNSSLAEFAVDNRTGTCSQTENLRNSHWTVNFNQTHVISQLRINTSESHLSDIIILYCI